VTTPDRVRITFRYRRGTQVHAAAYRGALCRVVQQRYTRRDVLGPVVEYLVETPDGTPVWVYESDVWSEEEVP